ncbi:hypothetical protein EDB19DRAFT_1911836 [Suillus lakei]|nr:hypothetical protein EDB19DRAFT_1911836 [Suillus lakei]
MFKQVLHSPTVQHIPVISNDVPSPSNSQAKDVELRRREKGKGKELVTDMEMDELMSRKRKSLLISGTSSQPTQSAMKSHKRVRLTWTVKSKEILTSEDDEDEGSDKVVSAALPMVVLLPFSISPQSAPSGSPRSPWSPKKAPYGSATTHRGRHADVTEQPEPTLVIQLETQMDTPLVIDSGALLILGPNNLCRNCLKAELLCTTRFQKSTHAGLMLCVLCTTKKVKCILARMGTPPTQTRGQSATHQTRSRTPSRAPSAGPPKATASSSQPEAPSAINLENPWQLLPATSTKPSVPLPTVDGSSSSALPRQTLNIPIPNLHSMSITIFDSVKHIKALEAHVNDQQGMIDTLQRLNESLQRQMVDRHPSFPLPDLLSNAGSFLLDQAITEPQSSSQLVPLPLINLSTSGIKPMPLPFNESPPINGLIFEPSPAPIPLDPLFEPSPAPLPLDPPVLTPNAGQSSFNLLPEYNSDNEMDAEVSLTIDSPPHNLIPAIKFLRAQTDGSDVEGNGSSKGCAGQSSDGTSVKVDKLGNDDLLMVLQ